MFDSKINANYTPKRTFYWDNGQGRDTYIFRDNGGFNRKQLMIYENPGISRMNNAKSVDLISRKTIDTPMIHHFSDGTGRD